MAVQVETQKEPLLIVGCGRLGKRTGSKWAQQDAKVVGETATERSHAELQKLQIQPRKREDENNRRFSNVMFAANAALDMEVHEYRAEVERALKLWNGDGQFLFTSSGSVYPESKGRVLDEESKTYEFGQFKRADRLLAAEELVREAGGTIVRLAGLFNNKECKKRDYFEQYRRHLPSNYLVNLITYDEAAELCFAALQKGEKLRGEILLGAPNEAPHLQTILNTLYIADGEPSLCRVQEAGDFGKKYNSRKTQELVGWKPCFDLMRDIARVNDIQIFNI